MRCPSCAYSNLAGSDECTQCGLTLMQEDTNPEFRLTPSQARMVTDAISRIPVRKAVVVHPTAPIRFVVSKMKEADQDCALMVDRGDVVGIFTERDALKKISDPDTDLDEMEIRNLMTSMPEVLFESDSIAIAINKMAMGSFRHVPVRRRDGTFTVISIRDTLEYLF